MSRVDNAKAAHAKKVELRRKVLELVTPANVFDAFCGTGSMWRGTWNDAATYLGCDHISWTPKESVGFRRLVCDNVLAFRTLALSQFNVFDLDAYGDPWEQALIIARRRTWKRGERGALVVTDGSGMKTRWGSMSAAMAELCGLRRLDGLPRTGAIGERLHDRALKAWLAASKAKPLKRWSFSGNGSGRGSQLMLYSAVVFEGA